MVSCLENDLRAYKIKLCMQNTYLHSKQLNTPENSRLGEINEEIARPSDFLKIQGRQFTSIGGLSKSRILNRPCTGSFLFFLFDLLIILVMTFITLTLFEFGIIDTLYSEIQCTRVV